MILIAFSLAGGVPGRTPGRVDLATLLPGAPGPSGGPGTTPHLPSGSVGPISALGKSGAPLGPGLPAAAAAPDPSPAWLADLLGVASPPATPPLVLASALPPIPGRAVDKILKGQFIEYFCPITSR